MASGPIISWQIDGETMETVTDFIFLGSKITVDGDWAMKLKALLLGKKAMTNLDNILKSRDITLSTKVCLVKAMVFPVVMYGCESWTIRKAKRQRIDAFELWCWRRLLRVPWTARRSNQSILKEISPKYSFGKTDAQAPILWPPDAKNWLIGKDADAEKDWRQEKKGTTDGWMASPTRWMWVWASPRSWWWTLACCSPWGLKELDVPEWPNWTGNNFKKLEFSYKTYACNFRENVLGLLCKQAIRNDKNDTEHIDTSWIAHRG